MKSHKGIMRRLKVTKTGKVMHRRAGGRHLLSNKTAKRKRKLRKWQQLNPSELVKLKTQYNFE